jgi:hypothetical protein
MLRWAGHRVQIKHTLHQEAPSRCHTLGVQHGSIFLARQFWLDGAALADWMAHLQPACAAPSRHMQLT